ncbi:MAG: serine hydrolase, partial [Flavisolibacter sp.]
KNYYFNIDPKQYFYPASTVKMPTAIMALQRLNELKVPGLDRNTTMITDSAYSRQDAVYNDPNSADGRPSIANYIRKIFLVSDNDAFNRLYEFLGQEYINNTLHKMGYDSAQIIHRLNIGRTEDENRHTNPVKFYDTSENMIYQQPLVASQLVYQPRNTFMGKGYLNGDRIINEPFNFSTKNRFALADLHSILQSVIFPKAVPKKQRFHLTGDDYRFLHKYMAMKPGESDFPQYDTSYNGAYSKLLMYGGKGDLEPDIRIFNKEGDAYGFLTDIAYIVDFRNNIEFFLSASIYCNSDGIFNDDHYDYENVGLPFLKHLGRAIYDYELKRERKHKPDLSSFRLDYSR